MVAAASDPPQPPLDWLRALAEDHPGVIEAVQAHTCQGGTHSRTRDGRIVCWDPPVQEIRVAVDAEVADQPVPGLLARRWGTSDPEIFWRWWTATEVVAKLDDVPILAWISSGPPVDDRPVTVSNGDVWWISTLTEGLRLTYGFLEEKESSR